MCRQYTLVVEAVNTILQVAGSLLPRETYSFSSNSRSPC